jgi:hypothetical protein
MDNNQQPANNKVGGTADAIADHRQLDSGCWSLLSRNLNACLFNSKAKGFSFLFSST